MEGKIQKSLDADIPFGFDLLIYYHKGGNNPGGTRSFSEENYTSEEGGEYRDDRYPYLSSADVFLAPEEEDGMTQEVGLDG